ncbi:B12-binding domain-containing radical SAM protein [bacterium]|nr:B12-binding domain-containing radical SAM protein [bacterium]
MKFLLVNPFCPIAEGPTPPLGISFLAAVLEKAEVEVKILDFTVFPYSKKNMEDRLAEFKPDIVGVTSVTMTFNNAIQVVEDVKALNPQIFTVMGGPHVSFCAVDTLQRYESLDLIVMGEGEETIVEIAKEYAGSKNWKQVLGVTYRDNEGIHTNEARPLLDVNTLPFPARHLLPLGRYRALHTPISMTTSRGCPFQCIFCIGRKMVGAKVRYRNPMDVVDELEQLSKLDFPQINISDDLFTAKKSHCMTICNEIIRRKLNITWSSFARVDTVSEELLKKMKEAGCTAVSFGVETANKEILKTIKKGITLEKVKRAICLCKKADILPHVSFILGLPGETPESLQETQEFGKTISDLGAYFGFHLLAPFPGTAVRDQNEEYDLEILTDNWQEYHANRAIVQTAAVNKDMLNAIAEEWDTETHKQLAQYREKMTNGTATEAETWQIVNLDRFLFIYQMMTDEIIEKYGSWETDDAVWSAEKALQGLAERIHGHMNKSEEEVGEILNYAYNRRSIHYSCYNNRLNWHWLNYLS